MSDLISREAVLELTKIISEDYSRERASFQYFVENLPSVEPQEWISIADAYKHGEWIDTEPNKDMWRKGNLPMRCSWCGHTAGKNKYKTYKFCPWCGAKMDKGE